MKSYALTHRGHKRETNEDQCLVKQIGHEAWIMAVADGMGGHCAGEIAAGIVKETFNEVDFIPADKEKYLLFLMDEAHNRIKNFAKKNPAAKGMGTTATAAIIHAGVAWWAHVGDSRLCRIRNRILGQATCDQNMAWFLVEEGQITEEEALTHPLRNLLDQSLGQGTYPCDPETGILALAKGDQLILMTDGIHGELTPKAISAILTEQNDIETKANRLTQAALDAGGRDNITVVMGEQIGANWVEQIGVGPSQYPVMIEKRLKKRV